MTPPTKRRRVEISCSTKKKICELKRDNPHYTIQDIRQRIESEDSLNVGKSTVSDILKSSEKWLKVTVKTAGHTRVLHAKHEKLEDALAMWTSDMASHHAAVNDEMLIEKAKTLGEQLDVGNDFCYSRGWLQRFKQRHGLKRRIYEGEAGSADMEAVQLGRAALRDLLKDYAPDDIFNLDETALFFRLGPNATLATGNVKGIKKSKDRITIALVANATGRDKPKAFVIGKVARPRCFGKTYNPDTYVRFRHNKKAWMTTELFRDWLAEFNLRMKKAGRKVILLVDNATSHRVNDLLLTNVRLHFLPPNTTAHIQPMDAGIISSFKAHYRKQLIREYISCAEKGSPQTVNLRQALHMVKNAWDAVSAATIINCFRHVQILPTRPTPEDSEDDMPLSELRSLMQQLPAQDECLSPEAYVNIDDQEETGHRLTEDDIIILVDGREDDADTGDDDDDDNNDSEEAGQKNVTIGEARHHIERLIVFFEETTPNASSANVNSNFLDTLWKMSAVLTEKATKETVQRKLTDYFKM